MQPDRPCYVTRRADEQLLETIASQRFAYVLSPRATGKSSLMARTIRRLRNEGQLAAVVDLTQIGSRGEGTDAGRWYYSIAYRIVRELRLKVDLQAWWHDKSALLNEQRLVEFFGDIVLAHTTVPVTIFVDEADRAIDLPFADELFSAIRSCYMRRVSEPDYARLNFVVLGVATPEQLCTDPSVSPFTDGRAIVLDDFTMEECDALAAGFGVGDDVGHALIERIYRWTHGHPYLTQKVARGVSRRACSLGDVDHVVRELLLASGASQEEPLLNHIRAQLQAPQAGARQAMALLARMAKGAVVPSDRGTRAKRLLSLVGIVDVDTEGRLKYRNAIFEQVFDSRFAKSSATLSWQRPVAIAAAVTVAVILPYWYLQVLPRPYVNTLRVVSQDFEVAREAYARLRRLPGFAGTADELLADAMVRRSEQTSVLSEAMAADAVLRSLPDGATIADETLARFWVRQSQAAMHRSDRDSALLYALAAARAQSEAGRALVGELIGDDYRHLDHSFRLPAAPLAWEVDWERGQLVVVDQTHTVAHLRLPTPAAAAATDVAGIVRVPGRLTAVQHVAVTRDLQIDADGRAGAFNLLLTTQHTRASDLTLRLRAPSGVATELVVPQPRADQQVLIFSARPGSPLTELSNEMIRGRWELTIVDRRSDEEGLLVGWGLEFAGIADAFEDVPESGIVISDPVRTEQIDIELAEDGRFALAVPSRLGAAGAMSVWDLSSGHHATDLEIQAVPEHARLLAGSTRALAVIGNTFTLWDVERSRVISQLTAEAGFLAAPAVSPEQEYIAVVEADGELGARLRLIASQNGEQIASIEIGSRLHDWTLGPQAEFLVILDGSRSGRIIDPRSGALLTEFIHERPLDRVILDGHADFLIAIDVEGTVIAWPRGDTQTRMAASDSTYLGQTVAVDSVRLAATTDRVSLTTPEGMIALRDIHSDDGNQTFLNTVDNERSRISPDGEFVVAESGSMLRLWRVTNGTRGAGPPALSAAALSADGQLAALGYRGGHVRVSDMAGPGSVTGRGASVDYIGHRGAITSIAINAERNLIASGGSDGVVRLWDLGSVAPNEYFLRHLSGPVTALAISHDGRWIISGAEYSARVWQAGTGELSGEVPVDGSVTAVAFSRADDVIAVGDSAGNIFLGAPSGSEPLRAVRAQGAVSAIAFSEDAAWLASGDANGNLMLWDVIRGQRIEAGFAFPESVSWIAVTDSGESIYVRSGSWVHRLERSEESLAIRGTRLLPSRLGSRPVLAVAPDGSVQALGSAGVGRFVAHAFRMAQPPEPLPPDSPLLERDWSRILGSALDPVTGRIRVVR